MGSPPRLHPSATQIVLGWALLGARQATARVPQRLRRRPDVERLHLDEVLAERGIECALEPLGNGCRVGGPNLPAEKDVLLEQPTVPKDCAVRVGELIDCPPILALVSGQLPQVYFGAGLRDEVRRAGH